MSDTTSAPVEGVDTPDTETDLNYDALAEGLAKDGFIEEPTEDLADDDGEEKIKLKVNGKTIEKTLPEVIKLAQLYEASAVKLETAKKEIEEARAVKAQLQDQQTGVRNLLMMMRDGEIDKITEFVKEKLGAGDVWEKAVIREALKFYEVAKMPPEQRKALENEKLVRRLQAEAEEYRRSGEQRAFEMQVNQWGEYINAEIPKAIKTVGLPDTAFVKEHIISTWRAAIERGQTPTAAAVANFVKKRLEESKLLGSGTVQQSIQPRPKATTESVRSRSKSNGLDTDSQYMDWDVWKKLVDANGLGVR